MRIEEYRTVAGLTRVHYIPKALEISVVTEDRKTNPVLVDVAVAGGENEVLTAASK